MIDFSLVGTRLHRGDADTLREQLSDVQPILNEGDLDHRFKGMFGHSSAFVEDVETVLEFLKRQQ